MMWNTWILQILAVLALSFSTCYIYMHHGERSSQSSNSDIKVGKQTRTRRDGVAQVTKDGSKTAGKKKRKKVSEIAAAANNYKRTKTRTNDPAVDGDEGKPVGDKTDAVNNVTSNKKKRVAGAGKKRKSTKPKKQCYRS